VKELEKREKDREQLIKELTAKVDQLASAVLNRVP